MVHTSLIILTRNEITGLKALIHKIPFRAADECFVIDYNSTDGTIEFLKKHHIRILQQQKPGRAEAFYLGAKTARGKFLIFFSPDGNENPADIPKLIALLEKGNDLAIATRFGNNAYNEEDDQLFKFRAWANQGFTLLANLLWHGHLSDSINGFRSIKKTAFTKLHLDAQGFAIEYQMSIRALKLRLKIAELPTHEGKRIGGKSGSTALPTGLTFVYYLLREIILGTRFNG